MYKNINDLENIDRITGYEFPIFIEEKLYKEIKNKILFKTYEDIEMLITRLLKKELKNI